ncbi:MAG: hypothetical protein NTW03_15880 [Verrucomicrobia bacterium]|nr:hypothetical protein [Verrucomicrobiota bacterium]
MNRSSAVIGLALLLRCLPLWPALAAQRELIRDPQFLHGFRLIEPAPGQRIPYGVIPGLDPSQPPVWDLDLWDSHLR